MFITFIGVNDKIVNLNAVVLIEDATDETMSRAIVTTTGGLEIIFEGDDADALLNRAELLMKATDNALLQVQNIGAQQS